jgi:hypothetical protein
MLRLTAVMSRVPAHAPLGKFSAANSTAVSSGKADYSGEF